MWERLAKEDTTNSKRDESAARLKLVLLCLTSYMHSYSHVKPPRFSSSIVAKHSNSSKPCSVYSAKTACNEYYSVHRAVLSNINSPALAVSSRKDKERQKCAMVSLVLLQYPKTL